VFMADVDVRQLEMKDFVFLMLAFLVCGAAHAADGSFGPLLGEQVTLIEKLETLSQTGEYDQIYALLASDYRAVVRRETFIDVSQSSPWKLTKLQFGTVSTYGHMAYLPLRAVVRCGDFESRIDSVLFLVKEESGWHLQNFPFLETKLPEFGTVPKWLDLASSQ
jgi:hypothetical protein